MAAAKKKPRAKKKATPHPGHKNKGSKGLPKSKPKGTKAPKGKTPKGRRLTAAKQSIRDTLMLTRKHQGWTMAEIAAEAGITRRQASTAIREKEKALQGDQSLLDKDMVEIVEGMVEEMRASVGDFEKIASAAMEQNNLPVAVGAKRGADDAREKLRELLQSVGALPHDLGTVTHVLDIRAVVVEINTAVEGFVEIIRTLQLPKAQAKQIEQARGTLTERLDAIGAAPHNAEANGNGEIDDQRGEHDG